MVLSSKCQSDHVNKTINLLPLYSPMLVYDYDKLYKPYMRLFKALIRISVKHSLDLM